MTDVLADAKRWRVSRRKLLGAGGSAALGLAGLAIVKVARKTRDNDPGGQIVRAAIASTPPLPGTLILGRPTDTTIAMSYLGTGAREIAVRYGLADGAWSRDSGPFKSEPDVPLTVTLEGLSPGRLHSYRILDRASGEATWRASEPRTFQTARPTGSAFTFTVQADSHRDDNSNPDLYQQTLANVRADRPDFHIDLGDTFMCDKFAETRQQVVARYVEEREWFGVVADSAPLFLVNGNHEGEAGWLQNGRAENLAVWAAQARLRYYLNPTPDAFYSGDSTAEPFVGQRASYYAWSWGSAQFIVLDPFWFTKSKPGGRVDSWAWTLGERQYRWLEQTLAQSRAPLKFVFIHHLVGGNGTSARGGVEAATFWEWGGSGAGGRSEFASKRPGWRAPIHALLVEHGVSAVFHGHDHLYVRQELDGVVYQEVPQPSHMGKNGAQLAAEGGYRSGVIRSSSGHLRISVDGRTAHVEYVQARVGGGAAIEHAYTIEGRGS